jgi:hypothetical protein
MWYTSSTSAVRKPKRFPAASKYPFLIRCGNAAG